MTLKQFIEQLMQQEAENKKKLDSTETFDRMQYVIKASEINTKIKTTPQKIMSLYPRNIKDDIAYKFISNDADRMAMMSYSLKIVNNALEVNDNRTAKHNDLYDRVVNHGQVASDAEFYEVIEEYRTANPAAYEKMKDISLLDGYYLTGPKAILNIAEAFDEKLDARTRDAIVAEIDSFVQPLNRSNDEITYKPFEKKCEELKNKGNLTQDQIDSLDFIANNIKFASREFGNEVTSIMQSKQMAIENQAKLEASKYQGLGEDKALIDEYIAASKNGSDVDHLAAAQKKIEDLEYDLSDDTKKSMLYVMKKIDSFGFIDNENILAAEEGTKEYAFKNVTQTIDKIEDALNADNVDKLPELVETYKQKKQEMDELLNFAKEHFNSDGKSYGCNVDVARNAKMPIEYRKEDQSTSLISSLMIATKFCKCMNVPFEEFCNNPGKLLNDTVEKICKRSDVNSLLAEHSLGEAISKLENDKDMDVLKFAGYFGTTMRAFDAIYGFEKDPAKLQHNAYVRQAKEQVYERVQKAGQQVATVFLFNSQETFKNLFLVKPEDANILKMCDKTLVNYDYATNKKMEAFNAEEYVKNTDYSPSLFKANIEKCFKDYFKADPLVGPQFLNMVEGAKMAIDTMLQNKEGITPDEKNDLNMFKIQLSEKIHLKTIAQQYGSDSSKKYENKISQLTNGVKFSREEITEAFKGVVDEKDATKVVGEKFLKKCFLNDLVYNNFDADKTNFYDLEDAVDMYVGANRFKRYNSKSITNNEFKKGSLGTIKNLGEKQRKEFETKMFEKFPKTVKGIVDGLLETETQGVRNRVHPRCETSKKIVNKIWENSPDKGTKDYENAFNTSCALLKTLEDKHNSRSNAWKFFHLLGQNREEKNTIEQLKERIALNADITEDELAAKQGTADYNKDVLTDIMYDNQEKLYKKVIYPFGRNDETMDLGKNFNKFVTSNVKDKELEKSDIIIDTSINKQLSKDLE